MSIHIILGKPGAGKSLYAVRRLIDELRDTERNIVTNLPVRPDRLNEYLQTKWPDRDFRLLQRLRMLTDDEVKQFWTIRGPEIVGGGAGSNLDAKYFPDSQGLRGVAYFLDEAHIAFNAREWASLGKGCLHYLSQHRKLSDIVWVITQAPGNLDKQFRSVAEDFTVIRNEYTAKYGIFRGRGRFVRRTYLSEPSGDKAEPFETAQFELDGVKECYDTAKGIGVHGSKADIGRRAKGIPIMWVIPAALVLALSCVFVPYLLGKGAQKFLGGEPKQAAKVERPEKLDTDRAEEFPVASPAPLGAPSNWHADTTPEKPLYLTGYTVRGQRFNAVLSDGRTLTERDGVVSSIERNGLVLKDGTVIGFRTAGRQQSQVSAPVVAPRAEPTRVPAPEGDSFYLPPDAEGVSRLREPVQLEAVGQRVEAGPSPVARAERVRRGR
jgi:hypothetical protein